LTLSITYDGGSISSNTAFSTFEFVEMAYRGEVGQGSITIDDATATRNIVGLKTVIATESQDVTDTRLFTGLTERRQLGRGDGRIAASEREWTVGLTDMNDVLRERVITSGKRPAETDVARATWLVGSGFLPGVVGTYISASGPVTLPATNYAGKYGFDVLTDCQDASSKNFFVTWNGSSLALFYDFETSSNFASTLRISDTPADIDYVTTFPPDWDNNPGLERDPGEVYSGMWLEYNGGHVLYQSGTIASNFRQREVVLFNDRPRTKTQATALATALVTAQSVEEDRITLSIHVDRQYVNKVRAGQRILLKARALGLTDFTAYRVVRKSTKPGRVEGGSPTRYTINLELAAPKKVKNRLHSVGRQPVPRYVVVGDGADGRPGAPSRDGLGSCRGLLRHDVAVLLRRRRPQLPGRRAGAEHGVLRADCHRFGRSSGRVQRPAANRGRGAVRRRDGLCRPVPSGPRQPGRCVQRFQRG
jgi:hypothetical protein